jgi:general stress protein 26
MAFSAEELLEHAREMLEMVNLCFATSVVSETEAHSRVVLTTEPSEDWGIRFMTDRRTRKMREFKSAGWLSLSYMCELDRGYVTVSGTPEYLNDKMIKLEMWHDMSRLWFPAGPSDPNLDVVELKVEKIEMVSITRGIMPEPTGSTAVCLARVKGNWQVSESWPGSTHEY